MNIKSRLDKLEQARPDHRRIEEMTDDELAAIITGDPNAKAADLTDAELKRIASQIRVRELPPMAHHHG